MSVETLAKTPDPPMVGGVVGKAKIRVKLEQLRNAVLPIEVTEEPIVNPEIPKPKNAPGPIVVTEFGITNDPVMPEQLKKVSLLIVVSWLESVSVPLKPEQL